jgi:hypothetical protein
VGARVDALGAAEGQWQAHHRGQAARIGRQVGDAQRLGGSGGQVISIPGPGLLPVEDEQAKGGQILEIGGVLVGQEHLGCRARAQRMQQIVHTVEMLFAQGRLRDRAMAGGDEDGEVALLVGGQPNAFHTFGIV